MCRENDALAALEEVAEAAVEAAAAAVVAAGHPAESEWRHRVRCM